MKMASDSNGNILCCEKEKWKKKKKTQRDLRLDVSESSWLHYQEKKSVCERWYLNRLELKINILIDG